MRRLCLCETCDVEGDCRAGMPPCALHTPMGNVAHAHGQRCTRPWATLHTAADNPPGGIPSRKSAFTSRRGLALKAPRVKKNSHCVKTFLHGICFSASKPLTSGCGVGRAAAKAHFARQAEGNEAVAPFCAKKSAHCTALKRAIRAKCLTLHHLRWVLFIPTV